MDFLALGKNPISPDHPTGSDARYEPEFDLLQSEIDKLSSPSAAEGTDWKKVHDTSVKILSEKSKDLFVACCLCVSLIHLRRIDGLADGLAVLHEMTTHYWDDLFPPKKRMRGRLGAIEFWIEKTESVLEAAAEDAGDSTRWEEIREHLGGLTAFLNDVLPEPPLFTPIERQVQRLAQGADTGQKVSGSESEDVAKDQAPPAKQRAAAMSQPPPATDIKPAASSVKTGDVPKTGAPEKDPRKIVQQGFQSLRQASSLIFEENPKDPSAYRYRRIEAWAKVSGLPPVIGDKTQVPPPPPHELQNIMDLRTSRSWQFLLRAAEHKVSQFIFWLDLNRFVAESLINLGEEYIRAHKVICDETAFLLHRLKGLDRMAFADGTPFADPETRAWIGRLSLSGGASPMEQISVPKSDWGSEQEDKMGEIIQKAQELVQKMQTAEAVGLIHGELSRCPSQKASLLWRKALCRILLGSDKKSLVLPHLELIIRDVDRYRLEAWDPELALDALKIVWSGYASFSDKQYKDKTLEIMTRMAKIDPVAAMRLGA